MLRPHSAILFFFSPCSASSHSHLLADLGTQGPHSHLACLSQSKVLFFELQRIFFFFFFVSAWRVCSEVWALQRALSHPPMPVLVLIRILLFTAERLSLHVDGGTVPAPTDSSLLVFMLTSHEWANVTDDHFFLQTTLRLLLTPTSYNKEFKNDLRPVIVRWWAPLFRTDHLKDLYFNWIALLPPSWWTCVSPRTTERLSPLHGPQ